MKRRSFIKAGIAALAGLKKGEYIYLGVGGALGAAAVGGALMTPSLPRKVKNDYSRARSVKSV
ncbi:hypothetical protein [Kushneria konosiri]|uniref:Uncharacterized protein n=1 Tax=Kushneria konosiri TaxID=698828 RepID=A0A2Z2H695_9GAMM|nr:hypothetical protein [Kushneria konosiri]ARS52376.1 hypothetical protein B9G99_05345 [Kushneria konosiri]